MTERYPPKVPMDADRVRRIADSYGADPGRWPAEDRAALAARKTASPETDAALARARELDRLLDLLPGAAPSAGLVDRVMAAAPRAAPLRTPDRGHSILDWIARQWPWEPAWRPTIALAFSALLGIAIGAFSAVSGSTNGDESDQSWELAFAPAAIVTEDL